MVLLEIDGREFHIGREPFQRDRTKQNALIRAGWWVLRFTVEDIRLRPAYVIAEIRHALDR
jgi:very-short-patch-repair endonuclease